MKRIVNLLLACFLLINLCGCAEIKDEQTTIPTVSEDAENTGHSFEVHYIDVGQGDAALVLCDGMSMLIDGGKPQASSIIYTYLKNLNIVKLDYIICSHADDDHIGGLSAPLSQITVENVIAPETGTDTRSYKSFIEKIQAQNIDIKHPKPGDSLNFASSTVKFFGPVTEKYDDLNNSSVVMKIIYGNTSFLFTGDAEREEEKEILDKEFDLSADVLKVGHHGSKNSTTYPFLRETMPKYAVISVGADNSYGHPTEDVLSRLRDVGAVVYRTDTQGDIIAESDGKTVTIKSKKNEKQKSVDSVYIGNKNSKKFHLPSCPSLPKEENRAIFKTYEDAEQSGYVPCKKCSPQSFFKNS